MGKAHCIISRKAGATVGFLRNCPKECRRLAYIALVRSRLEYAETVWDPYYQQDIEKLERVQRQAAHFITKDYRTREPGCVNRMLQDLNLQLPAYNTKQYQNSFFVRTVVDWNHLKENIVKAGSASAFTSALSRSTPPAS